MTQPPIVYRYPKSLAYIIVCVTIILALQVIIISRG